jgi:hypothetical protein
MPVAALVTWIITALGGFYMLATWISKGGHRQPSSSHFPPAVIFGHFALAAGGLIVWIIYLATDSDALKWIALVILLLVALLGFTMLAKWLPTYRSHMRSTTDAATSHAAPAQTTPAETAPAESHFPIAVVAGHGIFAVVTLVLVLLTALGVGGS